MRLQFRHLVCDVDRHGNERIYVRIKGLPKVRIKISPDDKAAFAAAYAAALAQVRTFVPAPDKPPKSAAPPGTFGWLAAQYFGSAEFKELPTTSQSTRRGIIEACLREPIKPGSADLMRMVPLRHLDSVHMRVLRDRKRSTPGAANNRLKYLSGLFVWATEHDPPLMRKNPCRDVKRMTYASEGFHCWTAEEVEAFEARWPIGTKPRLAMALMFYLGLRKQDAAILGRQHIRDGQVRFTPQKTRKKKADPVILPLPDELAAIIAASPAGDLTFLLTEYGEPYSSNGFGNWFRDRCADAGIPHCGAHGLRKARATILAERGATVRQLMAVFGWSSEKEAIRYTKAANRKKLAAQAMALEEDG